MKKIITAVTAIILLCAATNAFTQTTAAEWFTKAGEYLTSGDYANAVTAYSEAIRRDSTDLNAYYCRNFAYYQIKNYDAAIADCDTVIRVAPDFADVYVSRGDSYGAKGVYHKAAADFKMGLEKGYAPGGFNVDKSSIADMWFCGAMHMEIVVNRFLGNPSAVTRYDNWLNVVCYKNKVTRYEVEAFYRDNLRAMIAGAVDEEFRGITVPSQTVTYVNQSLTNFLTTPNQANFNTLKRIHDSTRNLTDLLLMYNEGMENLEQAQELGHTALITMYSNSVKYAQNLLNGIRRELNAPNDAPIDWGRFRSAYNKILNDLNPELVKKM
jgi:tetratricopeptide (TPR) repeat protein